MTSNPEALLERLKEVRQLREDYEEGYPTLRYCLLCDEAQLRTRTGNGDYKDLDCRHEHYDSTLEDAHDIGQISAWVDCIEHLMEEYDV